MTERSGGMEITSTGLLACPSCRFDDSEYARHVNVCPTYARDRDAYRPILYRSRFMGKWVVECQNCGMEVLFNMETMQETRDAWNQMAANASGERRGLPRPLDPIVGRED